MELGFEFRLEVREGGICRFWAGRGFLYFEGILKFKEKFREDIYGCSSVGL